MRKKKLFYTVTRLEEGLRIDYDFPSLKKALEFIDKSEKTHSGMTKENFKIDGSYELLRGRK